MKFAQVQPYTRVETLQDHGPQVPTLLGKPKEDPAGFCLGQQMPPTAQLQDGCLDRLIKGSNGARHELEVRSVHPFRDCFVDQKEHMLHLNGIKLGFVASSSQGRQNDLGWFHGHRHSEPFNVDD